MHCLANPILRRVAACLLAGGLLAGCQSTQSVVEDAALLGYAPEFPDLTCKRYGKPNGVAVPLTASRVTPGDPAYIEFRQRFSPAIPAGHMFIVFGRLDAEGQPVTRQYVGLFPHLGPVGLYAGAAIPMPAELKPSGRDCSIAPRGAYRVSLTEAQYERLLAAVGAALKSPPLWHMAIYNCNHFAASMGAAAGLKTPEDSLLFPPAYLQALIRINGTT